MKALPARLGLALVLAALVAMLACAGTAVAQSGKIELFPAGQGPTDEGAGIAAGPDGNVWFTTGRASMVARITPAGQVTEFPMPFKDGKPRKIAAGSDGGLWFIAGGEGSTATSSRIARIDTAGNVTEYFAPTANFSPIDADIAGGGDGAVWFTEWRANKIGRVAPDGQFAEYSIPTADSGPGGIAAGSDGNLWFAETRANKVARITPAGAISEFALPPTKEGPRDIATAPDGNLWLTEFGRNSLVRVGSDGRTTEFPIPAAASGGPGSIAADPHGNLWFTGSYGTLMRMTPTGLATEFKVPRPGPPCREAEPCIGIHPADLATGPDGKIWFVGRSGFGDTVTISRVDPDALPAVPSAAVKPSLHGVAGVGERITVRVGTWSNRPRDFSFRWQECDRRGENCGRRRGREASIVLGPKDIGHTIRAVVAAGNDAGSAFLTTAPTRVVGPSPGPLRVRIAEAPAPVGRGGKAKLLLSCADGPRGGRCSGKVLIGLGRKRPAGLGFARYSLVTGNSKRVSVPLRPRALALLAQAPRRRLNALVTVTLWGGRGAHRVVSLEAVGR